jgi:hypothetical protein
MSIVCPRCGGEVDLARTPLQSGLVRLAVLGSDAFVLAFDDSRIAAVALPLLGPCPHVAEPAWDEDALRPLAAQGWEALETASVDDARLAELAALWRPRALRLAGRGSEVGAQDALRVRLGGRLEDIARRMEEARAAGDEDEAERLHARYIELGMVYAGRTAAALDA